MEFEQFILQYDGQDTASLAMQASRLRPLVDDFDLALSTLRSRAKLRGKVPEWYALPCLRYPSALSAEQCSSTVSARYKASLVSGCVADLTGGLGVDSWAFAQRCEKVLYNEMNPVLSSAALHNFKALGVNNITVRNMELKDGNLGQVLDGFRPDVIFLDPARRSLYGRKVFMLKDCSPDVTALKEQLLDSCNTLMLKLSPMADIALVSKELGNVEQVHAVAVNGECKELLLLLRKGYSGEPSLTIVEDGRVMLLPEAAPVTFCREDALKPGRILFEPGKAMMKAGAFTLPCSYGMEKLGKSTHLFVADSTPEELSHFGKSFRIMEVLPFDKRSFKEISARYPRADVSARNIPMSSEELARRIKVLPGGDIHIFGTQSDQSGRILAVCSVRP